MDVLRLATLLPELPRERTRLLDNLGRVRREVGPITMELSDALADHMNIRRGEVHEVVSFYSFLQVPDGRGTRLHRARLRLLRRARAPRRGQPGAIEVACLGHCDLAPVLTRGDEIVPRVTHSTNDGPAVGLGTGDETLADYEARGGLALLRELPSIERIVEELKASGLTGYGGAGFPTGMKWEAVAREPAPRYVVVNADEGEPGTIKDRYVMELRPHLLRRGDGDRDALRSRRPRATSTCARSTRPPARGCSRRSTSSAPRVSSTGSRSSSSSARARTSPARRRRCSSRWRAAARCRACKPPFPSQFGYLGRPTLIHNVETLAHIPAILRERRRVVGRARHARRDGHAALVGHGRRRASPAATRRRTASRTRELVDEHAGGFTDEVGAIVPGGAASGILPPAALDAPLTRDGLREYGAGVGLGRRPGLPRLVLARFACSPRRCASSPRSRARSARRAGSATARCTTSREELEHGRAAMTREKVDEWLLAMEKTSICGLGQASPFPVRGAMTHWPELFAPLGAGS